MRNSTVLFCAGLLVICTAVRGADPVAKENSGTPGANEQAKSVVFGMPVAVPPDASNEMKEQAERLSKILGHQENSVIFVKENPTCCFWMEGWSPNPGEDGYVVIIQPGGGRIIASSMAALKRAIDHIERVRSPKTGAVPIGVLTSYAVATADKLAPSK